MKKLQRECPDFKEIFEYLVDGKLPEDKDRHDVITVVANNQYEIKDGLLHHIYTARAKKGKDVDPDKLIFQVALPRVKRRDVLKGYHDCKAGGGHFGVKRTYAAIKHKYYWPKMYDEIETYVKTCETCQKCKVSRNQPTPPLHPLPVEEPFSRIHIDLLCSLPKTREGYQYVLLIVDSFTKWTEAHPLKTQEAKDVAEVLYNEIFARYGAPRTIVSDRGANFMSKLVKALCEMFEVKQLHTSSYHPQTNATVERVNSTLAQTLRAYITKDQSNWPELLPNVMMAFRASPCTESSGYSPFNLMFGRDMNLPIDVTLMPKPSLGQNVTEYFHNLTARLKISRDIARQNMERAQDRAKDRHDVKAKMPQFKVGDKVLLRQEKVPLGLSQKLQQKWDGPFLITEMGPHFTYKLKIIATGKLLKSFINASRLKPFKDSPTEEDKSEDQDNDHNVSDDGLGVDQPIPFQPTADDTQTFEDALYRTDIRIITSKTKGGRTKFRVLYPDDTKVWLE
ncbi:hypothetical protein ACF0H5_009297 [Mactra antiquata]